MIALETLGRFGPLERLELYFERHLERRLDAVLLQQVHNHLSPAGVPRQPDSMH
jgi:hypothetical protein